MQESKEQQRRKILKEHGYFTVDTLLQKLKELKEKGYGEELIVSYDLTHLQYCNHDEKLQCVVIE